MLVYKFPGSMIEYLEGKTYDFKTIEESQLDEVKVDGWASTPDEAELLSIVGQVKAEA